MTVMKKRDRKANFPDVENRNLNYLSDELQPIYVMPSRKTETHRSTGATDKVYKQREPMDRGNVIHTIMDLYISRVINGTYCRDPFSVFGQRT